MWCGVPTRVLQNQNTDDNQKVSWHNRTKCGLVKIMPALLLRPRKLPGPFLQIRIRLVKNSRLEAQLAGKGETLSPVCCVCGGCRGGFTSSPSKLISTLTMEDITPHPPSMEAESLDKGEITLCPSSPMWNSWSPVVTKEGFISCTNPAYKIYSLWRLTWALH